MTALRKLHGGLAVRVEKAALGHEAVEANARQAPFGVRQIDPQFHAASGCRRRLWVAENGRLNLTGHQGGLAGRYPAQLNQRNAFRLDADFLKGELGAGFRGRSESADRQAFAGKILRFGDFRADDQLIRNEVQAAGDHGDIGSAQVGVDREGRGGKQKLRLVGEQRLHADGAVLDGDIFEI